jgi:hypothetical protein
VIVKQGDTVQPDTVVARTYLPGKVTPVNAANILNVQPELIEQTLVKKQGETLEKNEIYAMNKSFFGLFKTQLKAPEKCIVDSVSKVTGNILLRAMPLPVEVKAYIRGKVVEVIREEGVVVETHAAFVQGIFGIGRETFGEIVIATQSADEILSADKIREEFSGKIVVGGSFVTADALNKAVQTGIRGIVVGGFNDKDLREFLKYDIGVAITGHEDVGITLVITEGFGEIKMSDRAFNLLKSNQGKEASINGATQIRAGVIRPEVVIPSDKGAQIDALKAQDKGSLKVGDVVRIIRKPYFGMLGKVSALPPELQQLESESKARILEVELSEGTRAIIPRANVEMLEE